MPRSLNLIASLAGLLLLTCPVWADVVAEMPAEFSGTQRSNGWEYGYFDRGADLADGGDGIYDDTKFKRFRGGDTGGISCVPSNQWFGGAWSFSCEEPLAVEIADTSMYALERNEFNHLPVIRWVSDEDGAAEITGSFTRKDGTRGDASIGSIYHNGVEIFSAETYDEPALIELTIKSMQDDDEFDFVVDYGETWQDQDRTFYSFIIDRTGDAMPDLPGDFNLDGVLDLLDIDDLTVQTAGGSNPPAYDLNADAVVNTADVNVWVDDLFVTWNGDSNLDKQFNSGDLVSVLAAGSYETGAAAVWSQGDFNGDGLANTSDLVGALAGGGYENGPKAAVSAVPEPSSMTLVSLCGVMLIGLMRRNTRSPE